MILTRVATLTLPVLIEKLGPAGVMVARIAGVVLIGAELDLLAHACGVLSF